MLSGGYVLGKQQQLYLFQFNNTMVVADNDSNYQFFCAYCLSLERALPLRG